MVILGHGYVSMERHNSIRRICMTRFTLAAFCVLLAPMVAAAEKKPNIILIMADDLGFADL